jgi:hypothetical protein
VHSGYSRLYDFRRLEWSLASAVVQDLRSSNPTVVVPVLGVEDPLHFQLYIEKYKPS